MKKACALLLSAFFASTLLAACGAGIPSATPGRTAVTAASHLVPSSGSSYKLLYAFKGTPDGASPFAGLIDVNGTLYGTTLNGSKNYCTQSCAGNQCYLGCGTIFAIDKSGSERVIYDFKGHFDGANDGSWPAVGLTLLHHRRLYGTATSAGAYNDGTIFTVSASGNEGIKYNFSGADGESPEGPMIAVRGTLYGTTVYGGGSGCGGYGCGTAFAFSSDGKERVLHVFSGGSDGERVYAPLTYLRGRFYGAALLGGGSGCGGSGCGTIFEMTPSGKERVIYGFGDGTNGAYPNGLTAVGDTLYGTTEGGGADYSGTFFSVTPSGDLHFLYSFKDIPDGNLPGTTLLYHKGKFYSTTVGGGTSGRGTVFEISKTGSERVLYSFKGGTDGNDPQGPLILVDRKLYGTTYYGGGSGCNGNGYGTVFRVSL